MKEEATVEFSPEAQENIEVHDEYSFEDFIVTEKETKGVEGLDKCFYCRQPIGECHSETCAYLNKQVKVRMTVDYHIEIPAHWNEKDVEFYRNSNAWCWENSIDELLDIAHRQDGPCLCQLIKYQYLGEESVPYLDISK